MIITRKALVRLIRSEIAGSLNEQLAAASAFRDIWSMGSQRMRDRGETPDLYRSPVRSSDGTAEYEIRTETVDTRGMFVVKLKILTVKGLRLPAGESGKRQLMKRRVL